MTKKHQQDNNSILVNRKARFAYHLIETIEAGIALEGWEVKSLRNKQCNINDCYVKAQKGSLWIIGMHITPLASRSTHVTTSTDRTRRLLLHKKQIIKLTAAMKEQRMTCILTKLYWKMHLVKCLVGLAKGKQQRDKRQTIKERQWQREQQRVFKRVGR